MDKEELIELIKQRTNNAKQEYIDNKIDMALLAIKMWSSYEWALSDALGTDMFTDTQELDKQRLQRLEKKVAG